MTEHSKGQKGYSNSLNQPIKNPKEYLQVINLILNLGLRLQTSLATEIGVLISKLIISIRMRASFTQKIKILRKFFISFIK